MNRCATCKHWVNAKRAIQCLDVASGRMSDRGFNVGECDAVPDEYAPWSIDSVYVAVDEGGWSVHTAEGFGCVKWEPVALVPERGVGRLVYRATDGLRRCSTVPHTVWIDGVAYTLLSVTVDGDSGGDLRTLLGLDRPVERANASELELAEASPEALGGKDGALGGGEG